MPNTLDYSGWIIYRDDLDSKISHYYCDQTLN